jgi:hypothetical protein
MSFVRRIFILAALGTCAAVTGARADAVTDWNRIALETIPPAQISGPQGARALGYMHAAVFDAVNAIDRKYTAYAVDSRAPGASAEAAVAAAAHAMLTRLFPDLRLVYDAALEQSLTAIADGPAKQDGIKLGRAVGAETTVHREQYGAPEPSYKPGTAPSSWRPYPPAQQPVGLTWGAIKPFLLKSSDQFAAPGPLSVQSKEYAKDIQEVAILGGRKSPERTNEQTATAIFWTVSGAVLMNDIARKETLARGTAIADNARLFALLNMAISDALVVTWREKYGHNFLRPVTAIRHAAALGNPDLREDASWEPLIANPAHPDYPSGHCTSTGAAIAVMASFFGTDALKDASFTYPALGVTRRWASYTELAKEVGNARVWGGVHTRTADEHGDRLGRQIGEHVFANYLRPAS